MRPRTQITVRDTPPPRSAPTDTGIWFAVGLSDKGALRPTLVTSLDAFVRSFGDRVSYSELYDAVDAFFREGGYGVYIGREVGPAAVIATHNLNDAAAAVSLVVNAKGPGEYGNSLSVQVTAGDAGGTYRILVLDNANGNALLESSPDLTTQADAVTWSEQSSYVDIVLGPANDVPVVAAAAPLAGGTDDRNNITDASRQAALDLFSRDLGPGQVSAPGQTTATAHSQLLAHAMANNRRAILDLPDSDTEATLTTASFAARGTGNGRYGAAFGQWVIAPGLIGETTRVIPPSPFVAAAIARVDASDGPNVPAAARRGQLRYAIDLAQPEFTDDQYDDMYDDGVNLIKRLYGGVRIYGWRTLTDPVTDPDWVDFGNSRLLMAIAADADAIGEQFVLDQIDGRGHTLSAYGGALTALCQSYYDTDQIYGATPTEAFNVDVGAQVNTPETIANRELHAVVAVRPSPDAELVAIEIVNVPITEAVA